MAVSITNYNTNTAKKNELIPKSASQKPPHQRPQQLSSKGPTHHVTPEIKPENANHHPSHASNTTANPRDTYHATLIPPPLPPGPLPQHGPQGLRPRPRPRAPPLHIHPLPPTNPPTPKPGVPAPDEPRYDGEDSGPADAGDEGHELHQEAVRALQGACKSLPGRGRELGGAGLMCRQVVRRKSGKRHNGYRYIICKANPRHKQRQG